MRYRASLLVGLMFFISACPETTWDVSEELRARDRVVAVALGDLGRASSDHEYNRSMDAWIKQTLQRLDAVPKESGAAAMHSVDGAWWDSTKRVPDWKLVTRRNMDIGGEITPWRVVLAHREEQGKPDLFTACRGEDKVLHLRNPKGFEGKMFRDILRLEIEVDEKLAANGFPFPRPGSRTITQEDFPSIIQQIRKENAAEFGEGADRP